MDPNLTTLRAALRLGCKVNAVRVGDTITELVLVPAVGENTTIIRNPSPDVLIEYMRQCIQVNVTCALQRKYDRAPMTRDLPDMIEAEVNEELRGLPASAIVVTNPSSPGMLDIQIQVHHTPTMRSHFVQETVRIVDEQGAPVDLSEYTAEAEVLPSYDAAQNEAPRGQVGKDHGKEGPTETHQQDGDDHS